MTSDGSAAPETITLLQDVRGRPLTKSFRRVGSRIVKGSYPNTSEFRAFEVEVDGIASLATVLDEVAADGHAAVIRGAPGKLLSPQWLPCLPAAAAAGGAGERQDRRQDLAAADPDPQPASRTRSTATR